MEEKIIIDPPKPTICTHCQCLLPSRNQLFKHILICKENKDSHNEYKCNDDDDNKNQKIIRIVEEDEWYRIIIKPQGISTMGKLSGTNEETLVNSDSMLIANAKYYKKAVPCHRLDRATGGLVVCSKTKEAESLIRRLFREKFVHKRYRAIVPGRIEPEFGKITSILDGKEAITEYKVVYCTRSYKYSWISTVDLWPITGKKHQLRKHLCYELGLPILGDPRYAHAKDWPNPDTKFQNLMFLWALSVELPHPKDFQEIINNNNNNNNKDNNNNNNKDNNNKDENNNNNKDKYNEDDDDNDYDDNDNNSNNDIAKQILNCRMIKCSIDEPEYYKEFRDLQEREYFANEISQNKKIKIDDIC